MRIINTVDELREQVAGWKQQGHTIGFVPTMGNLHAGHLSLFDTLVETTGGDSLKLVASIFVNPMQFGINEDFDTYPRTFEEDTGKLAQKGVQLLFAPDAGEIYPTGMEHETRVVPPELGAILEGESRPGFFTGVATVVNKLFNMVQPDIACFGEKDYQQLLVIRRMVTDFAMPISILSAPIVREPDGLAMSSRNHYLDADQRELAAKLNPCLGHLVADVKQGTDCEFAVMHAMQELEHQGFIVDYVVVRRQQDLSVPESTDVDLVALVAARVGGTRLIDNHIFRRDITGDVD